MSATNFVVGVGGRARSGKDTLGGYLLERLNAIGELGRWERRKFAAPIKRIFMDVFGVDENFLETWKTLNEAPPGFQMPVRPCLTVIGDGFRHMKPTVWIDKLFRELHKTHALITDVRYLNEMQTIRRSGGVIILLHRSATADVVPDPSEQEMIPLIRRLLDLGAEGPVRRDDVPCDYFLTNEGSINDLLRKAAEAIVPDLIKRVRGQLSGGPNS